MAGNFPTSQGVKMTRDRTGQVEQGHEAGFNRKPCPMTRGEEFFETCAGIGEKREISDH